MKLGSPTLLDDASWGTSHPLTVTVLGAIGILNAERFRITNGQLVTFPTKFGF
jgi:hypothetical protein